MDLEFRLSISVDGLLEIESRDLLPSDGLGLLDGDRDAVLPRDLLRL